MDISSSLSSATALCVKDEYHGINQCSGSPDIENLKGDLASGFFMKHLYSEESSEIEDKTAAGKYGGKFAGTNRKVTKTCKKQSSGGETHKKPAYSYVALIATVLQDCPNQKMTLSEIYFAISSRWPFYKNTKSSQWQNSIRHNLSLNDCFQKVPKEGSGNKKGNYWRLAPTCKFADMFEPGQMQRRKRQRRSYDRSRGLGGLVGYTRNRSSNRILSYQSQATWPLYQDMSTAIDSSYQPTYGGYNYNYPALTSDLYSQLMVQTASQHLPNHMSPIYQPTSTLPASLTEPFYQNQLLSPDPSYSSHLTYDHRLLQQPSYYNQQNPDSPPHPIQYQPELINSIYTPSYSSGESFSSKSNNSWVPNAPDHTSDTSYDALTDSYTSCAQTLPTGTVEACDSHPSYSSSLPTSFVSKNYSGGSDTDSYSQEQIYNTLSMLRQPLDSHVSYHPDEYSAALLNRYREGTTPADETSYSSSNALLLQQQDDVINVESV